MGAPKLPKLQEQERHPWVLFPSCFYIAVARGAHSSVKLCRRVSHLACTTLGPGHTLDNPSQAQSRGCWIRHNPSVSPKSHQGCEHHLLPSAKASELPFQAPAHFAGRMKLLFLFPFLSPAFAESIAFLPQNFASKGKNESITLERDQAHGNGGSTSQGISQLTSKSCPWPLPASQILLPAAWDAEPFPQALFQPV